MTCDSKINLYKYGPILHTIVYNTINILYIYGQRGLGLWFLTQLLTIFQLYRGGKFY